MRIRIALTVLAVGAALALFAWAQTGPIRGVLLTLIMAGSLVTVLWVVLVDRLIRLWPGATIDVTAETPEKNPAMLWVLAAAMTAMVVGALIVGSGMKPVEGAVLLAGFYFILAAPRLTRQWIRRGWQKRAAR